MVGAAPATTETLAALARVAAAVRAAEPSRVVRARRSLRRLERRLVEPAKPPEIAAVQLELDLSPTSDTAALALFDEAVQRKGGRPGKGEDGTVDNVHSSPPKPDGNSKQAALRRLRKDRPKPKRKRLTLAERQRARRVGFDPVSDDELAELERLRPRTRADCLPGGSNACRPCGWAGCKWNLGLHTRSNGSLLIRLAGYRGSGKSRTLHPVKVLGAAAEVTRVIDAAADAVANADPEWSCALDVADRDEHPTFDEIAEGLATTKERPRQLFKGALEKLRAGGHDFEVPPER